MVKKSTKNQKTLIVVESPGKIKKIQSFLGDDFIIRASFGHIFELTKNKKNRLGVDIENGFKPSYTLLSDKKDKLSSIIDAASISSEILLASDNDREGESISFNLRECLESTGKPIKRIVFNEITKSAVLEAIKNPIEFNEKLYNSQQARRVLDRLVGFLVSPFLIQTVGPNLSAGRVQSVAVRLIIDREREIETFKPEEYWTLVTTLAKPKDLNDKFQAKYIKRITNKDDAMKIKKDLDTDNYEVKKVEAKEKKRNPLPPLITSTLQQAAAGRYGFPVSKTMKIAQSLYESGLITYMRTDSTRLSPESISSVREWLSKNNHKTPASPNYYASKGSAQDAHEAIRPTDVYKTPDKIYLDDDHQKVYRVIWERFVSCQMLPAIFDTVNILIETSSKHELKASGRTLKFAGWLAVATDQVAYKKPEDEDDVQLPVLKEGDDLVLVPPSVQADQKFTQPPPRYSEASLVKELEKKGIGRPSTYGAIIETIKGRGYVELKGKTYHGTDIGKKVIDVLKKCFKFLEYDYTANMELQLDKIAEGDLSYVEMLDGFFKPFQTELKSAYSSEQEDSGHKCSKCNSKMVVKHGKFGFYLACIDYPDKCKTTVSCEMVDGKPVIKEHFTKQVLDDVTCPKCSKGMIRRDGKFGPFYACSDFNCKGTKKVPCGRKCNKCGSDMFITIFNDQPKMACTGYPNCKNVQDVPKDLKVDWISPKRFVPKKQKKFVKKTLNVSR